MTYYDDNVSRPQQTLRSDAPRKRSPGHIARSQWVLVHSERERLLLVIFLQLSDQCNMRKIEQKLLFAVSHNVKANLV